MFDGKNWTLLFNIKLKDCSVAVGWDYTYGKREREQVDKLYIEKDT
jgi:FAD synthase